MRSVTNLHTGLAIVVALIVVGCQAVSTDYEEEAADPEVLHDAHVQLTEVMIHDITDPPYAARAYAYASIAAYETLAWGDDRYQSLAGQVHELTEGPAPPVNEEGDVQDDVLLPLAAMQAYLTVAEDMVFTQIKMREHHEAVMESFQEKGVPSDVFEQSVAYGDEVASHILEWAADDYYHETRSYPRYNVTEDPSRWQPTPPTYHEAVEPHWNEIRPFVLEAADQFQSAPPVQYSMEEGSAFYEQVMEVYEAGKNLSEEEQEIAAFWDCNPYALETMGHAKFAEKYQTPGGHWMDIATIANRMQKADFMQSAATYAKTAIALHDAFIASWDEKYRSNLVRPETVINREVDREWTPTLQTPPFPEYTSGHSTISAAAAEALTGLYGSFTYRDTSNVRFGLPDRTFDSFREAAEEAAVSRLYGGIHYTMANEAGALKGEQVGRYVRDQITLRVDSSDEEFTATE